MQLPYINLSTFPHINSPAFHAGGFPVEADTFCSQLFCLLLLDFGFLFFVCYFQIKENVWCFQIV
ncbi:hypothetical protein RchiOBHm_Chr6g0305431 [Rosa chinensis]|uniref:Uncharacterized protein n=1 Tax=Rosa chinensis TaxID=74649 RepID=A0A2P6PZX6_ROSCH|nr:hypothetical protein RchiOBHm_Chr6g0305431 [Rosa chinensis]